ncbi:hypothetical protein SAMN04488104_100859 [Algoriphagus faecimaris]|uniref:6-bladed beta-propeller protein n=1 Tax=Algoriphagus faecimaris TaxID=686796 RepID=A0A1G6Q5F4_9BACT|nr:hypothetical protein [Algoriphagus faecimaris]SDC87690.1 hypothetical protein SAMN04488104_100859 [Algoriphagus faecimaris]
MKKFIFAAFIVAAFIAACTPKRAVDRIGDSYHWVFQDSIQVDYMGELTLLDYEPAQMLFVARWNKQEEYVIFDESGRINHTFKLNEDGPNRIGWVQGINFLNGKLCVMEETKGIYIFDLDGSFIDRQSIPEDYFYINGLPFGAQKLEDELIFLRPERGESLKDISSMYSTAYSADILEVVNPLTHEIRTTMPFPPNTVYNSGHFYNWTFPMIIKHQDEWILTMLAEQKYFVYQEKEGEILFVKEVDLALEDAISMPGIPMNRQSDWYEEFGNVIFGRIENIYRRENDVIVIYTKGVAEEIAEQYDRENWEEWLAFLESIPRYAAIFDDNHELIQQDLPLPKGVRLSSTVTSEGAIIAEKNQEYFGVEEDFLIYYELGLAKD